MADANNVIADDAPKRYLAVRKKGLTKHGILYWVVRRISLAGVPFIGGVPLPEVDQADPEIGLPVELREG
jgi:hypothetical protein